jgi:hypothetical protein
MVDASVVWLVPGLGHPVYGSYAGFFSSLFHRFHAVDYREIYLREGGRAVRRSVRDAIEKADARLVIYSQFPSSYSYLDPEFLWQIGERRTVVGFGYDDEIYFEQAKYFYQSCAAVITTDIAGCEYLKQLGIPAYLAQLQLPSRNEARAEAVEQDIDISFVGDMSKPGRREYVSHLESCGLAVADYGAGSRRGKVSDAEVRRIFSRSKINLNFTATNPPAWILRHDPLRASFGQIKGRPFELAELGCFCLCEWTPCVEYWFRPGVDIAVFRNAEELAGEARRYIADDALRRSVAAAARARHQAELSSEKQFSRIFSTILAAPRPRRAAHIRTGGPLFDESIGRSRGIAFLHALRRASPLRALSEVFDPGATRFGYWRGFASAVVGALTGRS